MVNRIVCSLTIRRRKCAVVAEYLCQKKRKKKKDGRRGVPLAVVLLLLKYFSSIQQECASEHHRYIIYNNNKKANQTNAATSALRYGTYHFIIGGLGNTASKEADLAAQNKATPRGAKRKDLATRPPAAAEGFFSHLAADMPAIASSKAELAAVLKMSKIKAKPGQLDQAWSALASGKARPTGYWGLDACRHAALTAKVFLAGVFRNRGVAVGIFFILVSTIGGVFGGRWLTKHAPREQRQRLT